ncbi:MAG TPA: TonB-dependent receptor [Vicinamibacterales bacterium]|nr:TonB-dependent receptor [Vicinamibacterales bacterium]
MLNRQFIWVIATAIFLALPGVAHAQEATVTGTVTDSTGGVLPGVTVTAISEESGNTFVAVTDGEGRFRLPLRIGSYRIAAELAGFATVTRTGLQMQVGQLATVNLQMAPSSVQETVNVTGEAPLLDMTSSTVSGNIDQRQVKDLPVNGRNWLDLTLLAPGSRSNAGGESPIPRAQVAFQINMDGQQVTNSVTSTTQPRYSRDSIAEFEFISNRFDATQGHSMGVVVNAVSKSGTNRPEGTVSGYFRDNRLNATDYVLNRTPTYSNQQISATYGGPIRKDRIHMFANWEGEREPQTFVYANPRYPKFDMDLHGTRTQRTGGIKVDFQLSPQKHLSVRENTYHQYLPGSGGGATTHVSGATQTDRQSNQSWLQFTQVFGNNRVNELKGGYLGYSWGIDSLVDFKGGAFPGCPLTQPSSVQCGSKRYQVKGYTVGTATNQPQYIGQKSLQARDDFGFSYTLAGRHDVKTGGEFTNHVFDFQWCSYCNGNLDATLLAAPSADVMYAMFPVWNDASTWNPLPLSSSSIRYRQSVGDFHLQNNRQVYAAWWQDDWAASKRLTMNVGVRYDADIKVMGENIQILPWRSGHVPYELTHFVPRLGLAYRVNDRTVLHGGYGKYFTQLENDAQHQSNLAAQTLIPEALYDGRPDFAVNPFNGVVPTIDQARGRLCSSALTPTCIRREISSEIPSPNHQLTYSHQASAGVQRQIGAEIAVEANYVFTGQRREEVDYNMNLTYDPAAGDNVPFSIIAARPYPDWGFVNGEFMQGWSNYHGLETSFTKRFSHHYQLAATYTLAQLHDSIGDPCQVVKAADGTPACTRITFRLRPDVGSEYTLAATDQRHRAVVNGIWEVGWGLQASGVYFYGSGMRQGVSCSCPARDTGSGGGTRRLNDGTYLPRNSFVGSPLHRVDTRLQKRIPLGGRRTLDGMLELFNLFNHRNYGSYTTAVDNPAYGQPVYNTNVAYASRSAQLGFRLGF